MNSIELLAPAGSWEALRAVLAAGADAVYFSEKKFAMRQHGAWLHFAPEEIADVIQFVHEQGKLAYLAINNLLTKEEIVLLRSRLHAWLAAKPDALIVQDLGVLAVLRQEKVTLPIHASTMMNVHHSYAARWLKQNGVSRIITSRDITLWDAGRIGREADMEVEYFLHGDMCVAMGGQCFHSGVAAGFSSNRGKCLKSCRWPWNFLDRDQDRVLKKLQDKYILARNDLCLYHQIPELAAAGIHSLKIEGRVRPAEYLRPIVVWYREAIDRFLHHPEVYTTDFAVLQQLRRHTIRTIGTNHAMARPGVGSSGLTGEREPRFFSIAIEEPTYQRHALLAAENKTPLPLPVELSVHVANQQTAIMLAKGDCDWIYVGGERLMSDTSEEVAGGLAAVIDICHQHGKKVGVMTPHTTVDREFYEFKIGLAGIKNHLPDAFIVRNVGMLHFIQQESSIPVYADYHLNVWNGDATALLQESGVSGVTAGIELSLPEVFSLCDATLLAVECVVHGSLPGMHLEYCPIGVHLTQTSRLDPCPGPCRGRTFALQDRLGAKHWLEADQYCRNHVFMAKDLCTLDFIYRFNHPRMRRLRIEGMLYTPSYLSRLCSLYATAIKYGKKDNNEWEWLQKEAPRPLSVGAYGNSFETVSEPLTVLPTDLVICY